MSRELLARQRIHGNPIEPVLERFIEYLIARGHALNTWCRYVIVADHFGRWLGRRALSRQAVQQFITRHLPTCCCSVPAARERGCNVGALRLLLEMVGDATVPRAAACGFVEEVVQRYRDHLVEVRGLRARVAFLRMLSTRKMLIGMKVRRPLDLTKWTHEHVRRYVSRAIRGYAPCCHQSIASEVRVFLRFLLHEGLIPRNLAEAVPTFTNWGQARLPQTLTSDEIGWLVGAADARTSLGLRDRALVLCMSELGLRVSEAAALEVSGVDVETGTLWIRRLKERESAALPIPRHLAAALDTYLRRGRPQCASPFVFVQHRAPVGRRLTSSAAIAVVRRLAARVGLPKRVSGSHTLRHSFATRMLRGGANLKQIADLLGHQSINTTTIYAKVDMNTLSQVALPWPGTKEAQP